MFRFINRHKLSIMAALFFLAGLISFHLATQQPPYEFYSKTFVTRGHVEDAMEKYTPQTASDSLFEMKVELAQKSDELVENIIKQRPDYNTILISLASFLSLIGILLKILFDSLQKKDDNKHKELEDLITKFHTETLHAITKIKDIEVRDAIFKSLRKLASNYIHFNKQPIEVHNLIASQSERLISIMEEVMDEKLSYEFLDMIGAKIDQRARQAWKQVKELFGDEFLCQYRVMQEDSIAAYKMKLLQIVQDDYHNNKYERFYAASEAFLGCLISKTIDLHGTFDLKNNSNEKA